MCIYPGQYIIEERKNLEHCRYSSNPKKSVSMEIVVDKGLATLAHDRHCEPQHTSSTVY